MGGVHDDLATLRRRITNYASVAQDHEGFAALSRVEAELARLTQERDDYKADRDSYDDLLGRKMAERDEWHNRAQAAEAELATATTTAELAIRQLEAAEARCARLQQAAGYAEGVLIRDPFDDGQRRFAAELLRRALAGDTEEARDA